MISREYMRLASIRATSFLLIAFIPVFWGKFNIIHSSLNLSLRNTWLLSTFLLSVKLVNTEQINNWREFSVCLGMPWRALTSLCETPHDPHYRFTYASFKQAIVNAGSFRERRTHIESRNICFLSPSLWQCVNGMTAVQMSITSILSHNYCPGYYR